MNFIPVAITDVADRRAGVFRFGNLQDTGLEEGNLQAAMERRQQGQRIGGSLRTSPGPGWLPLLCHVTLGTSLHSQSLSFSFG